MNYQNQETWAAEMDGLDPLAPFVSRFHKPLQDGKPIIYFTGNSLGLQPLSTKDHLNVELEDWARWGVEGHFLARNPWYSYHERLTQALAGIVGCKESEVVAMNQLTVNLHLLLISFYQPAGRRTKIICEGKAFPSDQYALDSQIRLHNLNPSEHLIELEPLPGEYTLRTEEVIRAIETCGDELALVMMGGVNYFTGQYYDLPAIASAAHRVGAFAGFDLAHAAGNIPLQLHAWQIDFACWCSYKYLNSGPGGVAGAFVHEAHHKAKLKRLEGWWGTNKTTRFKMERSFSPAEGIEAWQLSNAPVLSMAAHKASLDLFELAGMQQLREKSIALTGYLEFLIRGINTILQDKTPEKSLQIITPADPSARGCQLSIVAHGFGKSLFERLTRSGLLADWREPNVMRMAPVPLYNTFSEVHRAGKLLEKACLEG